MATYWVEETEPDLVEKIRKVKYEHIVETGRTGWKGKLCRTEDEAIAEALRRYDPTGAKEVLVFVRYKSA